MERDSSGSAVWILGKAFEPHWPTREHRSNFGRSNHYESSINWEDDAVAPFQLLCQDKANAKCGIVSIRLADLETARQVNPRAATSLFWERDQKKGNPYHGNLLFSGDLPRPIVRELAAVIATHVQGNLSLTKPQDYDFELASRAARTTSVTNADQQTFWQRVVARVYAAFKL